MTTTVESREKMHVCMLTPLCSVAFLLFTVPGSKVSDGAAHGGLSLLSSIKKVKAIPLRNAHKPT